MDELIQELLKLAENKKKPAGTATKTNPAKWEAAKRKAKAKMGGKHSARAMQLATKYYKEDGGGYKGKKPSASNNKLKKWTKQDWQWSGERKKKSSVVDSIVEKLAGKGVYLPAKSIDALKSTKKGRGKLQAASRKKTEATNKGEQVARHGLHKGKKRSKLGAADPNYRDRVALWLHDGKGNLLVQDDRDKGLGLKFPGGGIDEGQSVNEAAMREALEEVGYSLADKPKAIPGVRAKKVDWDPVFSEEAAAKGRKYKGSKHYHRLALAGDPDESLLGSEGDALAANWMPVAEVLEATRSAAANPDNKYNYFDAERLRAAEKVMELLGSKTAGLEKMANRGALAKELLAMGRQAAKAPRQAAPRPLLRGVPGAPMQAPYRGTRSVPSPVRSRQNVPAGAPLQAPVRATTQPTPLTVTPTPLPAPTTQSVIKPGDLKGAKELKSSAGTAGTMAGAEGYINTLRQEQVERLKPLAQVYQDAQALGHVITPELNVARRTAENINQNVVNPIRNISADAGRAAGEVKQVASVANGAMSGNVRPLISELERASREAAEGKLPMPELRRVTAKVMRQLEEAKAAGGLDQYSSNQVDRALESARGVLGIGQEGYLGARNAAETIQGSLSSPQKQQVLATKLDNLRKSVNKALPKGSESELALQDITDPLATGAKVVAGGAYYGARDAAELGQIAYQNRGALPRTSELVERASGANLRQNIQGRIDDLPTYRVPGVGDVSTSEVVKDVLPQRLEGAYRSLPTGAPPTADDYLYAAAGDAAQNLTGSAAAGNITQDYLAPAVTTGLRGLNTADNVVGAVADAGRAVMPLGLPRNLGFMEGTAAVGRQLAKVEGVPNPLRNTKNFIDEIVTASQQGVPIDTRRAAQAYERGASEVELLGILREDNPLIDRAIVQNIDSGSMLSTPTNFLLDAYSTLKGAPGVLRPQARMFNSPFSIPKEVRTQLAGDNPGIFGVNTLISPRDLSTNLVNRATDAYNRQIAALGGISGISAPTGGLTAKTRGAGISDTPLLTLADDIAKGRISSDKVEDLLTYSSGVGGQFTRAQLAEALERAGVINNAQYQAALETIGQQANRGYTPLFTDLSIMRNPKTNVISNREARYSLGDMRKRLQGAYDRLGNAMYYKDRSRSYALNNPVGNRASNIARADRRAQQGGMSRGEMEHRRRALSDFANRSGIKLSHFEKTAQDDLLKLAYLLGQKLATADFGYGANSDDTTLSFDNEVYSMTDPKDFASPERHGNKTPATNTRGWVGVTDEVTPDKTEATNYKRDYLERT